MDRFLKVQIYNTANTQVEYDNETDTFWGIQSGTAYLDRIMMNSELSYGEFNSTSFEVQVFGLSQNIKLNGRKIVVSLSYGGMSEPTVLADENDIELTSELGDYIVAVPGEDTTVTKALFTGYIDSSETDILKTDRRIVAYDRAYTDKNTNIASWWSTWWTNRANTTLSTFKYAMLDAFSIPYISKSCINDSVTITNAYKDAETIYDLKLGDVLSMICRLQNCTPSINGSGTLEFARLGKSSEGRLRDVAGEVEGLNSDWKDYTTAKITGIAFYNNSDEPVRVVGTNSNPYNIAGNLFTLNMTSNELDTVGNAILDDIKDIQYTPVNLKMKLSDPTFELGDMLLTDDGYSYIMQEILSGSLLIEQNLMAVAVGEKLNEEVSYRNDTIMQATKMASINTSITNMSAQVVLTVDNNGNVGKMQLSSTSGGSSFEISADSLQFKANKDLNITTSNLNIKSTNFEVTSAGSITSKAGTIGGWTISANNLSSGGSSINPGGSITLRQSSSSSNGLALSYDGISFYSGSIWYSVLFKDSVNNNRITLTSEAINANTSFRYKYQELQTLLDAKKNSSAIHMGSTTCTFDNGKAEIALSTVGASSVPLSFMVCSQYRGYTVITYMYDESVTAGKIVLWGWDCDTNGGNGNWTSGSFRVGYLYIE